MPYCMLLAVWQVKVTVLEDNDPMDEYRYLLSVSTGHRRGASTSSQVHMLSVHKIRKAFIDTQRGNAGVAAGQRQNK